MLDARPMPLKLIHGPPNSGRAGLVRRALSDVLERDPVLVVPTVDDVYSFERELCEEGAALGASVVTFRSLFRVVADVGGTPSPPELAGAQRLRAVSIAIDETMRGLGPLRHSAARPGFAAAFERFIGELQGAGVDPAALGGGSGTLEGSTYLRDLSAIYEGYIAVRDRFGRTDEHLVASRAIEVAATAGAAWGGRPVFLYGLDDLTRNQLELIGALAGITEVTAAVTYEQGSLALEARSTLLERLRSLGVDEETATAPDPGNTESPLLFHIERSFGAREPAGMAPGPGLDLLRSSGERGEAEAVAAHVARLLTAGTDPVEIAIALRDPSRRGPLFASVLESSGIPIALEAEIPAAATAVGGAMLALLDAELGRRRASDLLRYLRGPSGLRPNTVDWLERRSRRDRIRGAGEALELLSAKRGEPPRDIVRLRSATAGGGAALASELAQVATRMASRPLGADADGPMPGRGDGLELRAAAEIATALEELSELGSGAPRPEDLATAIAELRLLAWSGPVEGRVRIASPYRLRASRLDHLVVASLQDGEFPRRDGGGEPFLSDRQRSEIGLEPRRDPDQEERYLFHACLAVPRVGLCLSYRDSDENGGAEPRSPLIDEVRSLLDPAPSGEVPDPVEEEITHSRDLARVVQPLSEAPSADALARTIAAAGGDPDAWLEAAGAGREVAASIGHRLRAARAAEAASQAPGPLTNPAVIESLAAVDAHGGTTLEGFDECSYRWFVSHELAPRPLDPLPDPIVGGGLMHSVLDRLYREPPGGERRPSPASAQAWIDRGLEMLGEAAAEGFGSDPVERAIVRRVEMLLIRFLRDEAERASGFEPWLTEATFGEGEDSDRETLRIDGWGLHGAIDRIDRDPDGRALVLDYKLAREVTPRAKFVEEAKLQLQLYMIAVAELWGAEAVGGLYLPLRGTSSRRPRGAVLEEAEVALEGYRLYPADVVGPDELREILAAARSRAGEIVARMRAGAIDRDPGPTDPDLTGHQVCPSYCEFAPICRRDRVAIEDPEESEADE
jgi:ATP-dependent helicase/DNAse subunit B